MNPWLIAFIVWVIVAGIVYAVEETVRSRKLTQQRLTDIRERLIRIEELNKKDGV